MKLIYRSQSQALIDAARENILNASAVYLFDAVKGRRGDLDSLCQRLVSVDYRDGRGRTPLMHAVCEGNASAVKTLLKHRAGIAMCDHHGHDVLWHAIHKGQLDIASLLLKQALGIDSKTIALLEAMEEKNVSAVELLLYAGASATKMIGGQKQSALDLAKQMGNGWFELISSTAIQAAIAMDAAGAVELLHKNGVSFAIVGSNGVTLLMHIITKAKIAVAKKLVVLGCDLNCVSNNGYTALVAAVYLGDYSLVEQLLLFNADCRISYNGQTLMRIAEQKGFKEIAQLLYDHGARDEDVELELELIVGSDDSGSDSASDDEYRF